MAAKSFGINLTFDYIFNAAKDRGFTRQGEMFSGKWNTDTLLVHNITEMLFEVVLSTQYVYIALVHR